MARFLERLRKEGVTWPQFFFQVVIVLLGVYLAILFERKAEEQNLREDTAVMLANVAAELREDEDELERVITLQAVRLESMQALADVLLRSSQEDTPAVDSLVRRYMDSNRTVFLRKSAYTTMLNGGYLRSLVRSDLPVTLASLYERTYNRVAYNGDLQDRSTFETLVPSVDAHLNLGQGTFFREGPEANMGFRNAALRIAQGVVYYRSLLEITLVEVREVRLMVEAHLNDN